MEIGIIPRMDQYKDNKNVFEKIIVITKIKIIDLLYVIKYKSWSA